MMRSIFCCVITFVVVAPPVAHQGHPGPNHEAVRRAHRLLDKSAEAYQKARALRDTMSIEIKTLAEGPQTGVIEYAFGAGTDAYFKRMGRTFTVLNDRMYVTEDDATDTYVDAPLEGDLETTRNQLLGEDSKLPVQFAMRAGRGVDAYVDALSFGVLENPKIAGHEMIKDEAGRSQHEITIVAVNGEVLVHIDATTHFVTALKLEVTAPGAAEGNKFSAEVRFEPKLMDSGEGLIKFDPTGRRLVKSIRDLKPTPIRAGDNAIDFTLPTLDTETVTLSRLRGSVVVLEFWATWCGPCREGLRLLQEFATWAEASGQPIRVYAVNVLERFPSENERKAGVGAFWKSHRFTMPTLLDLDNTVVEAYGYPAIPMTVIIDAEGKVAYVHSGSDPDLVEILKDEVHRVLAMDG